MVLSFGVPSASQSYMPVSLVSTCYVNTVTDGSMLPHPRQTTLAACASRSSGAAASCQGCLSHTSRTCSSSSGSGSSNNQIAEFGSLVCVIGTAGAVLLQRCAVNVTDCVMTGNLAHMDGGRSSAAAVKHFRWSMLRLTGMWRRREEGGGVVVRGVGMHKALASFKSCRFSLNSALGKSGGALLLDSGLGPVDCDCHSCVFGTAAVQQMTGAQSPA